MTGHTCVFDSRQGVVRHPAGPLLMCRCGAWGMPMVRTWQPVPTALLPRSCRFRTALLRLRRILRTVALALAFGLLLAYLVCPEGFR